MNYVKRDNCKTVKEVVERNVGMTVNELLNPKRDPFLTNLNECVKKIKEAIKSNKKINIIADYDCDGITSAAILFLTLKHFGVTPYVRIPKRFSEGYGVSESIINEINTGLLITVDNGISATEAIKKAKGKGLEIIIIDHHLSDKIPDADIILNPHVTKNNEFSDYCGAGLTYRVCRELLKDVSNNDLINKLVGLAAIGTIADVMPLIGDNRNIVIDGINFINDGYVTSGLKSLITLLKSEKVDEGFIGFNLAPIINAIGRLEDGGAKTAFRLLASESDDEDKLTEVAQMLIDNNNKRKVIVEEAVTTAESLINDNNESKLPAIVLNIHVSEGIVGIIAGKLAEKHKKPSIIFTKTEDGLKGSGRSPEGLNIKTILDLCQDLLIKYGGHPGAVGLLIEEQNFKKFKEKFCKEVMDNGFSGNSDTVFYDLEIKQCEIDEIYEEVKKYAPYGIINKPILFKVKGFIPTEKFGKKFTVLGLNHLKIFGKENDVIAFNLYDKFREIKDNEKWDIIGDMIENNYKGKTSIQIKAIDIL